MKKRLWFSITAKDCKWSYYKAGGKGGQKRNKTENSVRCQHLPSGALACCESFREKSRNKKEAFRIMAESKLFQSWLKLKIDAGLDKVEIQEGNSPARKLRLDEI